MITDISQLTEKHILFFNSKIRKTKSCWIWLGANNGGGYGLFSKLGITSVAHRISFVIANKTIPDGLVLDHRCRNRLCINPRHLRAVTRRENSLENSISPPALHAKATHCKHGHELDEYNTRIVFHSKHKRSWRRCLICKANWDADYRRKKKLSKGHKP